MIEINNLTDFPVDKAFFEGVAKKVLKGENKEEEDLSVAFVNAQEMQKLNKEYRKKDMPTDVLSFQKAEGFAGDVNEVVLCPEVVKKNAEAAGVPFEKELTSMFIHGILHTLGYDHEQSEIGAQNMFKKQEYYLSAVTH